ncbi:hypothetical protein PspLS_10299 [Pyricularia sp. CBS 133598]|nr:hypothetical protein PspLS_10299 [Pyricularia sp. CBS 133598]
MHFSKFSQLMALMAIAAPVLAAPTAPGSSTTIGSAGHSPAGSPAGSPARGEGLGKSCASRSKIHARSGLEPDSPKSVLDGPNGTGSDSDGERSGSRHGRQRTIEKQAHSKGRYDGTKEQKHN